MDELESSSTPSPVSGGLVGDVKEKLNLKSEEEEKVKEPEYQWTKPTSIDEFEIVDKLGDGAYGVVKLAYRKNDPKQEKVVIKYILKNKILPDFWIEDEELGKVPKEISILNEIKKKRDNQEVYIVNMIDYFEDKDNYYLITKQHGFGIDLFDYIEFNKEIPEEKIKKMFYQICKSIQFLHHNNIVHRDIKDENIIVDEDCNTELIDFGSSSHYNKKQTFDTFCGTIDYASPEVLTGHPYVGPPQDVWALGILLYILIYKENPFYNVDEIIAAKLRVPFVLSNDSLDLIRKLLNRNERVRIPIDKVLEHPWFNDIKE
ncbi:Pkinase-domain-containing protein [Anaeromyces robustus]|uniref:non-specific serine/threonine protein kinase n=1 Tax=Anaeromyces robustus TaxID=1754192 RepID=A0A1Y1XHG8_9FUNG|nr:Pkinase-domain-containing protein [Anaeromyces robustus]|eukprot:ORX85195.1 Pkinase-domain-containing protein [Anaeromyces robustus]